MAINPKKHEMPPQEPQVQSHKHRLLIVADFFIHFYFHFSRSLSFIFLFL